MFSISFTNSLFFLQVQPYDGFVRLFYGLLLLHACGGITVSRRPHAVDARPRRLRERMTPSRRRGDGVDGNGTPSRPYFGSTATERPRRGPNGLKISQKNTQRLL